MSVLGNIRKQCKHHGLRGSAALFSSVTPGLTWCWVQALQDHDTVISVIDAVVVGTEMSSWVAGIRTEMVRRWHWAVARSMLELLRRGMLGRQVQTGVWQEPQRRYWRPNAVAGEKESRTRTWSLPRSIQGRDHADSDIPWRRVWKSLVLARTASEVNSNTSSGRIWPHTESKSLNWLPKYFAQLIRSAERARTPFKGYF